MPVAGEQVVSVRQNLPPLVSGGQPSPNVGDVSAWGATLGGGTTVARSALGEDAQGNLLFAGGMSLQPTDLAAALVSSGAVTAMELDINPEWVQLAYAATPGGAAERRDPWSEPSRRPVPAGLEPRLRHGTGHGMTSGQPAQT